jgi:hypothetical protein
MIVVVVPGSILSMFIRNAILTVTSKLSNDVLSCQILTHCYHAVNGTTRYSTMTFYDGEVIIESL